MTRRTLEFFSGTGSVGRAFRELGWEVTSVDVDSRANPTICKTFALVARSFCPVTLISSGLPPFELIQQLEPLCWAEGSVSWLFVLHSAGASPFHFRPRLDMTRPPVNDSKVPA